MLDTDGKILYVGKAQNLKSRVSSYFRQSGQSTKTVSLMKLVDDIKITVTQSNTEALILECTLIKKHLPRYNILLRDDKSFPYILLTEQHNYPRLSFFRGKKKRYGKFFGPYPNAGAVHYTLDLLQKTFRLRSCRDAEFANRARPCMLHQIKRCNAPCVGEISKAQYDADVENTIKFLEGKSKEVIDNLTVQMDHASQELAYEKAALIRDQILHLRNIQEKQYVSTGAGDADVIAVAYEQGIAIVYVLNVRQGQILGGHSYFPKVPADSAIEDIAQAFVSQFYLSIAAEEVPKQIIVDENIVAKETLAESLTEVCQRKIEVIHKVKVEKSKWLDMARVNAKQTLSVRLASKVDYQQKLLALQKCLGLENLPKRIECFDISHTMGEATVASCVVYDQQGELTKEFRKFNIKEVAKGDDYAALRQAVQRRYQSLKEKSGQIPDIVLVDGGKGQLTQLEEVLLALELDYVKLLAIAKGSSRKHGLETIYFAQCLPNEKQKGYQRSVLHNDASVLHLLRQIDERAHDFAISGHQKKREKVRLTSQLDTIPGIGNKRRLELLRHFGSLDAIRKASEDEIQKVDGISLELAKRIYRCLHDIE